MSAFVLNRGYELQLPSSYVDIEKDEMEYVDGGGTIRITLSKSTIQWIVGSISGTASSIAITVALDALGGTIATAVELGTAGAATLAVGAFLLAWHGFAAAIATGIAGCVIGTASGNLYTGGSKTFSKYIWGCPNFSKTF